MAAGSEWDEHFDPALLAAGGTLHAFCTAVTSAADGTDRTAILHRSSPDGGNTWTPSARVTPASEPLASRAVPFTAPDGRVRVLYQTLGPLSPRDAASTLRVATLGADGTWSTAPAAVQGLAAELVRVRLSTGSGGVAGGGVTAALCAIEPDGTPRLRWLTSADGLAWKAGPAAPDASADLVTDGAMSLFRSKSSPSGLSTVPTGGDWATATPAEGFASTGLRPGLATLPGGATLAFVPQVRVPYALVMYGRPRPGAPWAPLWNAHDAASGASAAAVVGGKPVLLLEAGEAGRRETVSFLRIDAND
jgi:hypothetical protein